MKTRTIGFRILLWYGVSIALILLVYSLVVFAFLYHRLDRDLADDLFRDAELAAATFNPYDDAGPDSNPDLREKLAADWEEAWLDVLGPDGQPVFRYVPRGRPRILDAFPPPEEVERMEATLETPGWPPAKAVHLPFKVEDEVFAVRMARSEKRPRRELATFLLVQALALPVAVLISGLGGFFLTRRVLSPIGRLVSTAQRINAERLGDRLPVENPHDELGHLAIMFNQTLARVEASFNELKRFTADASHELRTPLTAMRSVGEIGLREGRGEARLRETIASMLEEADRMARLVDSLLTLSRADSGKVSLVRSSVDLADLAAEAVEYLGVLAEDKEQSLSVAALARPRVLADRLVLRQALVNVLDNAIKYTPEGGRISVRVDQGPEGGLLEVADTGPGIAPQHADKVFERFYRVDKGRSRESGGTGLGLAIAKWAVEANGGRIGVISEPGRGSRFRMVFPAGPGTPAGG